MEFPTLKQGSTSRELLTAFPGYSGCPRPAAGAFTAMENCSARNRSVKNEITALPPFLSLG